MEYGVLGALRVADQTAELTPRGKRPRDLLAMLLLRYPGAVDASVLLDGVWGDEAAELAPAVVHTVVARLRRSLGEDQVETSEAGYRLRPGAVLDAVTFADLVRTARGFEPAQASESVEVLRSALALWRGDRAFDDVSDDLVAAERQRLDALRATAVESLAESLLTLPDPAGWTEANERAEALIAVDPLRERPYELVMLSSYRAGRQADALSTFTRLRTALRDELGIDPGPGAVALQRRILAQDPSLGGEQRRAWTEPVVGEPPVRVAVPVDAGALVGRSVELGVLGDFLTEGAGALVLVGTPGIGKSALWEATTRRAAQAGNRVLRARPGEEETRFSFSVLSDLLDGIDLAMFDSLPRPQREALENALLRSPSQAPPDSHAISLAVSSALTCLAEDGPVVVAVDDVQWMDTESAEALTFASRRLDRRSVRFLLTRRATHERSALERAFPLTVRNDVEVGPLDLDATGRLLKDHGLSVPRRVVRQVHQQSGGNALFVQQLADVLEHRGVPENGQSLGVPAEVEELLGTRVDELALKERTAVLAVALEGHLSEDALRTIVGADVVEALVRRRLLVVDGGSGRVRAWHPLIAAGARDRSTPAQRRTVHQLLAGTVVSEDSRVRHLALGNPEPDENLAAALSLSSSHALARRAFETAVELSALALDRTPSGSPNRAQRVIDHADQLAQAGWTERLTEFLTPEVDALPPGLRGQAWLMLSVGVVKTVDHVEQYVDNALRDSGDDVAVRAKALAQRACVAAAIRVTDIPQALAWGAEAVALEPTAVDGQAWAQAVAGIPITVVDDDALAEHFLATSSIGSRGARGARALQHSWRGEIAEAKEILVREVNAADTEGRMLDLTEHQLHLAEVHIRAGDLRTAEAIIGLYSETDEDAHETADLERVRGLLCALAGDVTGAAQWAEKSLLVSEEIGVHWARLEALRARGTAAAFTGDLEAAASDLGAVWDWCVREGVGEPGAFPVAPDLVDTLVGVGRIEEAVAVADRLQVLAETQDHPWARAANARCRARIGLATDELSTDEAAALLMVAAEQFAHDGLPGDEGRARLDLARCLARGAVPAQAAAAYEAAIEVFELHGASGWAERARSEMSTGLDQPASSASLGSDIAR